MRRTFFTILFFIMVFTLLFNFFDNASGQAVDTVDATPTFVVTIRPFPTATNTPETSSTVGPTTTPTATFVEPPEWTPTVTATKTPIGPPVTAFPTVTPTRVTPTPLPVGPIRAYIVPIRLQ